MSIRDQFGGAKSSNGKEYANLKLDDGKAIVARILPAMHSLREKDLCMISHAVHFGYAVPDQNNPGKTFPRPFACIEEKDFNSKMIITSCPQCREYEKKEQERDDLKSAKFTAWKKQGVLDEKQLEALAKDDPELKAMGEWLYKYNRDFKWYMNVVTLDGQLGVLRIADKAKKKLVNLINDLRKKGIEPISDLDKGVYFTFLRTGNWSNTDFTVVEYMEELEDKSGTRRKWAPLSDDVLERAIKNLPDLTTLTTVLTGPQIQMLVETGGDPEQVEVIFKMTQDRKDRKVTAPEDTSSLLPASGLAAAKPAVPKAEAKPEPKPEPAKPVLPPATVAAVAKTDDQIKAEIEAKIRAQVEAEVKARIMAEMSAKAAPATPPATPAASTPVDTSVLDPKVSAEDFAAQFGSKLPPR